MTTKSKILFLACSVLATTLIFGLGFSLGRKAPNGIYRTEVSLDAAAQNPNILPALYKAHGQLCYLLAEYRPPIDDSQIDQAVSKLLYVRNHIKQLEQILKEGPGR